MSDQPDNKPGDTVEFTPAKLQALKKAGCTKIFREKVSGASRDRPELKRMLDQIREGDVVVVWKLDRLSRRQHEGINLLAQWCEHGVRVVSVTQQIDLNGAVGRMIASVMFGLAEIEQEYRRERQAAGARLHAGPAARLRRLRTGAVRVVRGAARPAPGRPVSRAPPDVVEHHDCPGSRVLGAR